MSELDEVIGEVYKKTNIELVEMINEQRKEYNKNDRKRDLMWFAVCVILSITIIFVSFFAYLINKQWIETFNSYEYETVTYTQDGNGINNYNSGTMGDVENGSNNCNQEKEEEGTTSNNSY